MTAGARVRRLLFAAALVASLVGFATPDPAGADAGTQGCSSRAVVVVEPGPGPVTICFDGTISGLDALQLAGANPVTYGFAGQGGAVCQLYGVGNPADSSCLVGPGGQYWAYYRAGPGAGGWTYSRGGASSTTVTDGSVEGWKYGTGAAPGFVSFCAVAGCAPPPTDPPPVTEAAPPVTAAPATAAPVTGAPSDTAAPGTTKPARGSEAAKDGGRSGDHPSSGAADPKRGGTTTTGKSGTKTSDHRPSSGNVELASGGSGGGGGAGSPVGVVVALAAVAVAVATGLLLRRRRRGPAPG